MHLRPVAAAPPAWHTPRMSEPTPAYIDFTVHDDAALQRLVAIVAALHQQKLSGTEHSETHWLPFFTDADRAHFWWPDDAELAQWADFWSETPVEHRIGPDMPMPPWDFASMIDAITDGEYTLTGVEMLGDGQARLGFEPHAYPHGGIDALRMLVRAFGHRITGFDDGTGPITGDPQSPRWTPPTRP